MSTCSCVFVCVLNDDWCLRSTATAKLPNEVTPAKILRHACHCCRRLVVCMCLLCSLIMIIVALMRCCNVHVVVLSGGTKTTRCDKLSLVNDVTHRCLYQCSIKQQRCAFSMFHDGRLITGFGGCVFLCRGAVVPPFYEQKSITEPEVS